MLYSKLEAFKSENEQYKRMKMERSNEQNFQSRLIRNETINISDQVKMINSILAK